jgi:PadR family transcriptional regulator, regulatory protein PadR
MRLMTRSEEMVLLAVWKLKDTAYGVAIRDHLIAVTGKDWSFGSIFDPLDRLEKKGLLRSALTEPVKSRGGKCKRVYRITNIGRQALAELYRIQKTMWDDPALLDAEPEKVRS